MPSEEEMCAPIFAPNDVKGSDKGGSTVNPAIPALDLRPHSFIQHAFSTTTPQTINLQLWYLLYIYLNSIIYSLSVKAKLDE